MSQSGFKGYFMFLCNVPFAYKELNDRRKQKLTIHVLVLDH